MELETKFDEDFIFYLSFVNAFLQRIDDDDLQRRCRQWLHKICGEPCQGTQMKRCRNIYLTNLLICMQEKVLEGPFIRPPAGVNILDATQVFDPYPEELEGTPAWLEDSDFIPDPNRRNNLEQNKCRTYLATRTLPDGQGAFAYIGISMVEDENMWLGAGEGGRSFDEHLQQKYHEHVPPTYDMEKILAKRKDPREREKVLTFYDVLMQGIADELDGNATTENATIEGLLRELKNDLQERQQYAMYEQMGEEEQRAELLLQLHTKVKARRDKVAKREELLDEIEGKMFPQSFLDTSVQPEDKYQFPAAMWEQAINRIPNKKQMERLQAKYPIILIEKYVQLLSNHKEVIAVRMQRRHEHLVTQMKKELRKEGAKKKKITEESQSACDQAVAIHKAVKKQYKLKTDTEQQNKDKFTLPVAEHTRVYEAMRAAVLDTQRLVEEEAERGKFLASQINTVSEKTEQIMQVNEDMVEITEAANMKILKNIKRLNAAVKTYETRIADIQSMAKGRGAKAPTSEMFFF